MKRRRESHILSIARSVCYIQARAAPQAESPGTEHHLGALLKFQIYLLLLGQGSRSNELAFTMSKTAIGTRASRPDHNGWFMLIAVLKTQSFKE